MDPLAELIDQYAAPPVEEGTIALDGDLEYKGHEMDFDLHELSDFGDFLSENESSPQIMSIQPVTIGQDYTVTQSTDFTKDDLLNALVNSNNLCVDATQPQMSRSPSVEQLLKQLDSDDNASGNANADLDDSMPDDLHDINLVLDNEFFQDQMDYEKALEPASSGANRTSMATTYEFERNHVTDQPQQLPAALQAIDNEQHKQNEQRPNTLPKLSVFQSSVHPSDTVAVSPTMSSPDSCNSFESATTSSTVVAADNSWDLNASTDAENFETQRMAEHIIASISKLNQDKSESAKPMVHEVVSFILLHDSHCNCSLNMEQLMCFCNQDGNQIGKPSSNFVTKNTKLMGMVWQKVKRNRNSNYDTFARAMRVGRERNKGHFGYLLSGRGSKKKVYRLEREGELYLGKMQKQLASMINY